MNLTGLMLTTKEAHRQEVRRQGAHQEVRRQGAHHQETPQHELCAFDRK